MSIKFEEFKHGENTRGKLICRGVGKIANSLRRILLDEIEMIAFDTSEAHIATSDLKINHSILLNIELVRVYEEGEFYIKVDNNGIEPIAITSNMIYNLKTKSPAKVYKDMLICTLEGKHSITIRGIKTVHGTGRQHAKFSAVMGPVTYDATDVAHVYYLNERGFIEDNKRKISVKAIDKYNRNTMYIIIDKRGLDSISEQHKKYMKEMTQLPDKQYEFLTAELHESDDFVLTFYSENVEITAQQAIATLISQIKTGYESGIYTTSAAEVMRQFIYREVMCPIYCNSKDDNYCVLTISHNDAKKIEKQVYEQVLKILSTK